MNNGNQMFKPKKNRCPELTCEMAAHIKWLWEKTPLNQAQIAAQLGPINQGRVSEVISGKRFEDVAPAPLAGGY